MVSLTTHDDHLLLEQLGHSVSPRPWVLAALHLLQVARWVPNDYRDGDGADPRNVNVSGRLHLAVRILHFHRIASVPVFDHASFVALLLSLLAVDLPVGVTASPDVSIVQSTLAATPILPVLVRIDRRVTVEYRVDINGKHVFQVILLDVPHSALGVDGPGQGLNVAHLVTYVQGLGSARVVVPSEANDLNDVGIDHILNGVDAQ
mmetsp:Transcript_14440/g.29505  ORF Transcript_14440/g.29505 Transcript_14440/m.29505 type:complete len:205 (+) Transcript_14440:586-1200(+)